jgi:5-methylcytosine-specific restriction endonuclease McrA
MAFSPDMKYAYYDGQTNAPIDAIYRHVDANCDHDLEVFARLETSDQRWQIYRCCVKCGEHFDGPLPYAQHEDFMSYPRIDDRFTQNAAAARQVRVRWRRQNIFAVDDSGGFRVCDRRLNHAGDCHRGTRALYRWNECVDSISHKNIARGGRRLLQYALHEILLEDRILGAWMATDIDLSKYEEDIESAFNEIGLEVDEVYLCGLDDQCADDLTLFGEEPTYSDYLKSTQWQRNREAAMRHEPNITSRKTGRPSCENPYCRSVFGKVDCHHLTYRNVGHEQPGELMFLCRECHNIAEFFKSHTEYASRSIA